MKIVSSIVEYNPFHNGHKYHLEESVRATGASHSIALMSSSFVQRGEPALVDKWTRAKMAIENGIDLVLELPFIYSCQSAELFAYGAVNILNSIQIVDYLSFGSEVGDLKYLHGIVDLLVEEPDSYKESLRHYLSMGYSFPHSRSRALIRELNDSPVINFYENILKGSNNILAIEYLKSLKKLNSKITPITIPRLGANYNDLEAINNIASATGIRKLIFNKGLKEVGQYVPKESSKHLSIFLNKYKQFNSLTNYESILNFLLLTKDKNKLKNIIDVVEGLENRIVEKTSIHNNINNLIESISTKRYPLTRIQRILIHLLNDLDESTVKNLYDYKPQYVRVLGSNAKGLEILSEIKRKSNINIISKYARYKSLNNEILNKFLYYEEKATDIFFWGLQTSEPQIKYDYYTSPYIKI